MGNRAVITTAPFQSSRQGIYLHWNGGRASIEGFLQAARELNLRPPGADPQYALASLCHLIALFFDTSGLSVGMSTCDELDCRNGDNGVYQIGGNWEIVGRSHLEMRGEVGKPSHMKDFCSFDEVNAEKTASICKLIVGKVNAAKAYKGEEEPKKKRTKKAAKV